MQKKRLSDPCVEIQKNQPAPLIGDTAPSFDAETTQGLIHFPADYNGKWVILFSHPSDFSPICTTELIAMARLEDECRKLNTELIGLSVDSLSSHIAWLYAIQEQIRFRGLSDIKITFPLIADLSQTIARRYGMIQPESAPDKTIRAVYFIDPDGIIRTILYYPLSTGRNFKEIWRILLSLQTADAFHVSTPADWQVGDDVVKQIPSSADAHKATDKSEISLSQVEELSPEEIRQKLYQSPKEKAGQ